MNTIPTNTLDKARFLQGLEDQLKDTNVIGYSLKDTRCLFLASKILKLDFPFHEEQRWLVEKVLSIATAISTEEYPSFRDSPDEKRWYMAICNFNFITVNSFRARLSTEVYWKDEIELDNPYFIFDIVPADPHGVQRYPTYRISKEQFVQLIEAMVDFVNNGK